MAKKHKDDDDDDDPRLLVLHTELDRIYRESDGRVAIFAYPTHVTAGDVLTAISKLG